MNFGVQVSVYRTNWEAVRASVEAMEAGDWDSVWFADHYIPPGADREQEALGAFEAWLRDHGGNIVNISAPFEGKGAALQAHVAAAKAGVDSLTRTCAVEWGRHGVRVNGVMPGPIADTEGVERFDAAIGASGGSSVPLGREGARSEIASVVLFLVSEAASYVSGQVFAVDGASTVDQLGMASRLAELEAAWPER